MPTFRPRFIYLLFVLLLIISACSVEGPSPLPTPTLSEKNIEEIEEKVKSELAELDPIPFYTPKAAGEAYPSYMLAGLSSGQIYTDTFDKYILDVLDVYLLLDSQVVTLPLIVGFSDGTTYVNTVMGENIRGDFTRAELLDHITNTYSVETLEKLAQEDFPLPWFLGKLIRQGE